MNRQELEIEFKNMLSYHDYDKLKHTLFMDCKVITQTNFYIDTKDDALKNNRIALRIRDTGEYKVMTLKIPQEIGIMEYHGAIDGRIISHEYIEKKYIPENIQCELQKMNINYDGLTIFGALSTERRELHYMNGILVLDANYYLDTEDYELEYEVSDFDEGEMHFNEFLNIHQLPFSPASSKVMRFYDHYKALTSK